jgi:hypothetical protein
MQALYSKPTQPVPRIPLSTDCHKKAGQVNKIPAVGGEVGKPLFDIGRGVYKFIEAVLESKQGRQREVSQEDTATYKKAHAASTEGRDGAVESQRFE